MKQHFLIMTFFLFCPSFATFAGTHNLTACPPDIYRTHAAIPELPSLIHNEFTGSAVVSLIIEKNGDVKNPEIIYSKWQPLGRSSGQPRGYHEAIIKAVTQWRYAPQQQSCRLEAPIDFVLNGTLQQGWQF